MDLFEKSAPAPITDRTDTHPKHNQKPIEEEERERKTKKKPAKPTSKRANKRTNDPTKKDLQINAYYYMDKDNGHVTRLII